MQSNTKVITILKLLLADELTVISESRVHSET